MPHTFSPAQLHAMKTPFIKWQVGHISFALPPTSLRSGRFNLLLHPWLHGGRYYIFEVFHSDLAYYHNFYLYSE